MRITRAQFFQTVIATFAAFFGVKKAASAGAMSAGEVDKTFIDVMHAMKIETARRRIPFVMGGSYADYDPDGIGFPPKRQYEDLMYGAIIEENPEYQKGRMDFVSDRLFPNKGKVVMITTRAGNGDWVKQRYLGKELDKITIDEAVEIKDKYIVKAGDKLSIDFKGSVDPFKSGLIFNIKTP